MDRIERLERSVSRWRWATCAAFGVAVLAGAAQALPDRMTLREVQIVDAEGRQRIRLDPEWGAVGPGIALYSKQGKPIAAFYLDDTDNFTSLKMTDHVTGKTLLKADSMSRQGTVEVSAQRSGKSATFTAPGALPF